MKKTNKKSTGEVEVLYQRMGDRWYAFSLVGEEVFFGQVDPQIVGKTEENADEFADFETLLNRELAKGESAA